MGKVLDVYWHCAEPGDNYLGRVVAGLNALKPLFNILLPHFEMENPLEDELVGEAMHLMYGPIFEGSEDTPDDPRGVLLRALASVIHHFDWIQQVAQVSTDHPFNVIPLFFQTQLVNELKQHITTSPSDVVKEASGIPLHVEHSLKLQKLDSRAPQESGG